jgi:transcriptional regulator with XRE-family HTH domain
MAEQETNARGREVGARLRSIREYWGMNLTDVADKLGWSPSKVSRLERGLTGVSPVELVRYAAHCGGSLEDIDYLLEYCRKSVTPGYWLSNRFASLIFHESTAKFSASWCPQIVPGLLQTQEYATALFGRERLEPDVARYWADLRADRQELLHSRPFEFYIHEQALRLPVGGNRVMNEQILKLLLTSDQLRITIRVIPTAVGARGIFGPPFVFYRFNHSGPLVHLDGIPAGLFVEDREYVTGYHKLLADMTDVALGIAESREVLATVASDFDIPEDPPDDPQHLAEEQLQRRLPG